MSRDLPPFMIARLLRQTTHIIETRDFTIQHTPRFNMPGMLKGMVSPVAKEAVDGLLINVPEATGALR